MSAHVTADDLQRLRNGTLPAGDVLAVARHLASCAECARDSTAHAGVARAAAEVHAIVEDEAHPDVETELTAYIDGTLKGAEREHIKRHLERCAICREDAADLARVQRSMGRARLHPAWYAAAAALVLAVGSSFFLRRHETPAPPQLRRPPVVVAQGYGRADWDALVRDARTSGSVAIPAFVSSLRGRNDVLRGDRAQAKGSLQPNGVVVESAQPHFSWPRFGSSYVVEVYDGEQRIARSETLNATEWTPASPLPRNRKLAWQVRSENALLPSPPDPHARFRIADAHAVAEIEAARQRFPNDRLLIGLLEARAGMLAPAAADLAAYARAHPDDATAHALAVRAHEQSVGAR